MDQLTRAVKQTNAWACYDCGKCTATCPVARAGGSLSPRRQVLGANSGRPAAAGADGGLAACLTCAQCDERCPAEVRYTDLVLELRQIEGAAAAAPECPHGGALQSMMRMLARGTTRQDRLTWLTPDLKVAERTGSVFLWTGCTPYYDAFFPEHKLATLNGTRAAVKVLNALGIEPVVSAEERCCGHDLLWNGDRASFEALARHNLELVSSSGAELLVTPCAECLRTWVKDYPRLARVKLPRPVHLTELVAERLGELPLAGDGNRRVTFQDPCRLGRHLGIYQAPRTVLEALPGVELTEMRRSGSRALCCAGGTWSSCDRYAKKIQVDRLREARATGAEVLVTACPKCQIHFSCAMKDPKLGDEISIELRDVAELVAAALGSEGKGRDGH